MNKKIIMVLSVLLSFNSFALDSKPVPKETLQRPKTPLMQDKIQEALSVCEKEAGIDKTASPKRVVPTKEQRVQVNNCMQLKVKELRAQHSKK